MRNNENRSILSPEEEEELIRIALNPDPDEIISRNDFFDHLDETVNISFEPNGDIILDLSNLAIEIPDLQCEGQIGEDACCGCENIEENFVVSFSECTFEIDVSELWNFGEKISQSQFYLQEWAA